MIKSLTLCKKGIKYKSLIEIVKQINEFLKDNKTTYLNI